MKETFIFLLALVCVACAQEESAVDSQLDLERHLLITSDRFLDERIEGYLGHLKVEDDTQEISFYVLNSSIDRPSQPPVYFVEGGPGVSGISRFSRYASSIRTWRLFADVVIVDQRGTDYSRPKLDCAERWKLPLDQSFDRAQSINDARRILGNCAAKWRAEGVNLQHYGAYSFAEDVLRVAKHLGHDRFQVVAFSYGTQIAHALIDIANGKLVRAVLAGPFEPGEALRTPADYDRLLERVDAYLGNRMQGDGQLAATVKAAATKLDAHSLLVKSGGADIVIDGRALRRVVGSALGSPEKVELLPRVLQAIVHGKYDASFKKAAETLFSAEYRYRRGPVSRRNSAQHFAATCITGESDAHKIERELQMESTVLGHFIHEMLPEACDALGVRREPARSWPDDLKIPVLLVAGTLDSKAPQERAQNLAAGQEQVTLLTVLGGTHGELLNGSMRVSMAIAEFLQGNVPQDLEVRIR